MKRILSCLFVVLLLLGMLPAAAQNQQETTISKEAVYSALYNADIATMRQAIDAGLVSCEELTTYYLERIEAYNSPYKCFITLCDDALEVARQRDQALADGTAAGILFGIPIVIKDNIDLAGYHTTNGHKKTDDQIADSNATIVSYLLEQGAVILGKTNMSTDAQSGWDSFSQVLGETKNAYNLQMSAAGSSGGSAVATSLNFAAASIGTDTNSSLRLPAAFAGCVSLRGTHGLVSTDGVTPLNKTRDIPGAITRSVYDQAIMLDVLTNGQYHYTENLNANALLGLRIGVLKELAYPVSGQSGRTQSVWDNEIAAAFEIVLQQLQACGAEIVPVSMPNIFKLSSATMNTNDADKKQALYDAFDTMLDTYDVSAVVFPSYVTAPLYSVTDENGRYSSAFWEQTFTSNCTILAPSASLPEITVPMGVHSRGCGMAFEIATRKNQEQLLLDMAYTYTSTYDQRVIPEAAPDTYQQFHLSNLQQLIDLYWQQQTPPETEPSVPETEPSVPETEPTPPETEPTPPETEPTPTETEPTPPETEPTPPETEPTPPETEPTPPETEPTPPETEPTPPKTEPTPPETATSVPVTTPAATESSAVATVPTTLPNTEKPSIWDFSWSWSDLLLGGGILLILICLLASGKKRK